MMSQVLFATERVVEEKVFDALNVDVITMFLGIMWTQVALGFVLLPLQSLKTLGNLSLESLPEVFWQGLRCTFTGSDSNVTLADGTAVDFPPCSWVEPTIMFSYILVDFSAYSLGLYVIQKWRGELDAAGKRRGASSCLSCMGDKTTRGSFLVSNFARKGHRHNIDDG